MWPRDVDPVAGRQRLASDDPVTVEIGPVGDRRSSIVATPSRTVTFA